MAKPVVVVTGATGFLGQAVVARLEPRWSVVEWETNLLDRERTRHSAERLGRPDAVVHLAKPRSEGIQTMLSDPLGYTSTLLRMDVNLIDAAARYWPDTPLVCTGSVCAYPQHTDAPTREIDLWMGYPELVNAPYGVSSRMQLELLNAAARQHGLPSVHFLTANLYGPGDSSAHVIPSLIRRMIQGREQPQLPLEVWGSPLITRSFLYVDDAAEAIARMIEPKNFPGGGADATVVNLAAAGTTSMQALVEALCAILRYQPRAVNYLGDKPTGHHRREFSIDRLRALLDWEPATTLAEGLQRTVDWHLKEILR